MGITDVISLLGGIALFLFGMLLMGEGLKTVAGNKLELVLYKLSSTPLKGVLLGTGITAIIQSSSATSIMVVGFVNSGMMKVKHAIGIVLGAILGTSVTGWIVCLSSISDGSSHLMKIISTATLTGVVAVAGIILRMFCKKRIDHNIGNIFMGFAVLMTGMSAMSVAVSPLRDSPFFINALTSFKNPFIAIIVGMLFTCVLQSASATVGILQALSMTGAITFEVAFPLIMGIAIGAALPVLFSALGTSVAGKRVAFIFLIINTIGVIVWSSVFYTLNSFLNFTFMTSEVNMVSIALINTLFRLATVVLLTPFIKGLEKIVSFIIKDNPEELEDNAEIERLEERFVSHPAIAIEQSNNAVCSMAIKARKNLSRAISIIYEYSDETFEKIQTKEQVIDKYEDKLGTYLVKLTGADLSASQSRDISKILHAIGDIERIADHAVNLSVTAKEINQKKLKFSPEAQHELDTITSAISEVVILATDSFINNDIEMAKKVEPLEQVIDSLCDEIKMRHVKRVQTGECSLDHGFVFNDLLTNFERIADHCSNIAVAIIELEKDLFDTHEYLSDIKTARNKEFSEAFDFYSGKYSLTSK